MADKISASSTVFRPHFKTHQSIDVGKWFREKGVEAITVSSLSMANEFADAGWKDITIAFPVNLREIEGYNSLSKKINLNLLIDSIEIVEELSLKLKAKTGIFLEIDTGYERSGIHFTDKDKIDQIIAAIESSEVMQFNGFLTHSGDTYAAKSLKEIEMIYNNSVSALQALKETYPNTIISLGDTPACSIVPDLSKAEELRPGNFVYYDLMQHYLGVCSLEDIAVSVACPVTGIYPERNEIVIYGGAIHLSKEFLDIDGKFFGLIVKYTDNGWSEPVSATRLKSISQEHGIISTTSGFLKTVRHGDLLGVLPVHSCLTANLLKESTLII